MRHAVRIHSRKTIQEAMGALVQFHSARCGKGGVDA